MARQLPPVAHPSSSLPVMILPPIFLAAQNTCCVDYIRGVRNSDEFNIFGFLSVPAWPFGKKLLASHS